MANNARVVRITIKIAVVVLLIKELWLLLGIPSFTDAVMSFLTVGAIPGTDRTLTPDEIYKLIGVVGVLFIVLVFRKDVARLFWRKHAEEEQPVAVPVPKPVVAAMPLKHPLRDKTVKAQVKQPSRVLADLLNHKYVALIIRRATAFRMVAVQKIGEWYVRAMVFTQAAAQRTWAWIKIAALVTYRIILLITIITINLSIAAWHWAEPRIRKLDAIIEKKVHSNEYTSGVLAASKEIIEAIKSGYQSVKAIASDLVKPSKNTPDE